MQRVSSRKHRDWLDNLILVTLVLSLIVGFALRTYRMDWDRGHVYLFHPDERALAYSAIANISFPIPPDLAKLLRPDSPLNPHFFNYGNLPMYLTRAGAHVLSFAIKNAWTNENLWMAGRGLSAIFDILTILIAYRLGRKLYGRRVGLLAALLGSFTVMHIQLSHFLTVDTFLTTFITLGMYFSIDIVRKGSLKAGLMMGVALGLAMGTKVSVAPLLISVVVAWGLWALRGSSDTATRDRREGFSSGDRLSKAILGVLVAVLAAAVCFVATMPYAIIDWTNFIRSVDEQSRMVRGIADYPYTRQYLYTPVFLYQIWHTAVWGMGLPLGVVAYAGFVFVTLRTLMRRRSEEIVLLSWVLVYFFINGIFQVKFMRYMLPLFPFLAIMGSELLWQAWDWAGRKHNLSLRAFFRIPVAFAQEPEPGEEEYLDLDAEAEDWERQKAAQAGMPAKPSRRVSATPRRRGRQVSIAPIAPIAAPSEAPAPTEIAPQSAEVISTPSSIEPIAPPETEAAAPAGEPPAPIVQPPLAQPAPEVPSLEAVIAEDTAESIEEPEEPEGIPPAALPDEIEPEPSAPTPPLSLQTLRSVVASWTRAQVVVGVVMAFVVLGTVFYALAFMNIYRQTHTWITISEWIYRNVPAGSTISNEHWDDALPLGRRVDGQQRNFEQYKHVEAKNYEDDNQAKLDMLVANITKADYIVLATNRLYGTISRLPERYPITSLYYELLFAEKLGFKLVAVSAVYPSFLGVTIMNDTLVDPNLPRPELLRTSKPAGLVINLGKADESFTVYDHPMPLVFQKVEQIGEAQVRAMFDGTVQLAMQYQAKRQASASRRTGSATSTKTFLLTESERTAQEAGGDYMSLFNPDNLANRLPVVFWWLAVQLIALISLPIGYVVFGNLRDRGYGIVKTLGLLLVAYLPWLAGSFKLLPFGRISIFLSMAVVAALSLLILRKRQDEFVDWLRRNRWLILSTEVVFSVAFLAFVGIRVLNPDLWQPWNGGEKPMEFAFLGAIARSTYFPPYDPFFAGGYINYYYYGMYICAMVIRLTGIMPSVAFNLIIPLLFALTMTSAFSITYNLVAGLLKKPEPSDNPSEGSETFGRVHGRLDSAREFWQAHGALLRWALAGALFVAVIGNLATVGEVFKGPWNRGQTTSRSSIPGVATIAKVVDGIRRGLQPNQRMFDTFNYWNPSRVIPETINEFPFWSYLFADLHPHTIGIPFTLMVLGLALNIMKETRRRAAALTPVRNEEPDAAPEVTGNLRAKASGVLAWVQERLSGIRPDDLLAVLVLGLAVGSLGAINTWDLPTYLGVIFCAILLRAWLETGRFAPGEVVARFGAVLVLSLALYWPFYQKYEALASGIGLVRNRTPLGYYLAVSGFFIFAIASFMVIDVATQSGAISRFLRLFTRYADDLPVLLRRLRLVTSPRDTLKTAVVVALIVAFVVVVLALLKQGTIAFLLPFLLIAVALGFTGDRRPERVFTWVLVFVGFLISLGIEIFFLRDWLQGGSSYRMNTLFKFGIQQWIVFGLASAVGLAVVTDRLRPSLKRIVSVTSLWYVGLAILLFIVFLFPVLGIPARVNDRFPGARPATGTLDGTAFMSVGKYSFDWDRKNYQVDLTYDYQAIQWLLRNVKGSPVIAEAVLPYYRELGARISAYTGLPTLIGNQHEQEQRPGDTQVGPRENDARAIFSDASFDKILPLLIKHRVRYIYVGQLEQAIYPQAGLAKFDQAVGTYLDLVYENPKAKIYQVRTE
jgi:YYY domain-containing protein